MAEAALTMITGSAQESAFVELKLSGKLPSPSGVGMQILHVTRGDKHSSEEIGRTIEADPALTGRILKIANSSLNASVQGVTTVAEATVRLGLSTVRSVALGFTLVGGNRHGACSAFDYDRFWARSVLRAVAARQLAEVVGSCQPAEAFICGLLSEIGRLALASVHPTRYAEILEANLEALPEELSAAEQAAFHIRHGQVAAELMAEWGLPALFSESVAELEAFEEQEAGIDPAVYGMQAILFAAGSIAEAGTTPLGAPTRVWQSRVDALLRSRSASDLDEEAFSALYARTLSAWKEWSSSLELASESPRTLEEMERLSNAALPVLPSTGHKRVGVLRGNVSSDRLRLFLVEDDPRTVGIVRDLLHASPWDLQACESSRAALKPILDWSPHVILASEKLGGVDLCESLRRCADGQMTHFMLLSEGDDVETLATALEDGVDEHVDVPVHPRMLAARIRSAERVIRLQQCLELEKETVRQQVAELGVLTRRLRAASLTDPLTELPNRRFVMKRLEQDWAAAERSGAPLSVVSIDIDQFKSVNDEHGHETGDIVLREVARVLHKSARKGEQPARTGGEEFLIVLRDTGLDGARMAAERIRAAVQAHHIEVGNFSRNVTISLGVATRSEHTANLSAMLKAADEALYAAKRSGRNRVCTCGETSQGSKAGG